jgi:hypothetical protein
MASETIDYWLTTLPEPYRTRALREIERAPIHSPERTEENAATALEHSFYWHRAQEREDFWNALYELLEEDEPIPPPVSFPSPWPR